MNVIICGAGRVGYGIAQRLAAENNTVTVVDLSADLIRTISTELDVKGVVGHGSHPSVLTRAGVQDCDMIIAVTYSDEVNMVACQIAHSLFDVPTKIARVRSQDYLAKRWTDLYSRENMPIDIIISPEIEIGKAILRRLSTPGTFDVVPFANGQVQLLGVTIGEDCPVMHMPIRQIPDLFQNLHAAIVGIRRHGAIFAPSPQDPLEEGDEAYFVTRPEQASRLLDILGINASRSRNVIIVGGGNIGRYVAQELEGRSGIRTRIIERDKKKAERAADVLSKTVVLNGDAMDTRLLEEAGVAETETIICLTNDDKTNLLAGVLAKKLGCGKAYSLVNDQSLQTMKGAMGIDLVIDPRASTVSSILRHVRRGRIIDVFTIDEGAAEVIEGEILETSPMAGKLVGDDDMPEGVTFGAILRGETVILPQADTQIRIGDRVVLLAEKSGLRAVENLFRVSMDYF